MFDIKISNYEESDKLCETWATKCVSLIGPDHKNLYKTTDIRHFEFFDDIDFIPDDNSTWVAPTRESIERVLKYSSDLKNSDKLLVHCHAGISRSTAMLLGILCQHGVEPYKALELVEAIRPELWPNNLVVQYCDEVLNLEGRLIKAVIKFKKENAGKFYIAQNLLPDVEDDITIEFGGIR
jgi:predicted protein tyrosine phosphatase